MPPKPAVLTSPFRKEIENMLLEGKSSRYISGWLKEQGEDIGYGAINSYRNNHFNPTKEAGIEYQNIQSKKRKTRAKNKVLSDLEFLDQVKDAAGDVKLVITKDTTALDIVNAGIRAVRAKNEILKQGEDGDKEVTIYIDEFNQILDKAVSEVDEKDVEPKDEK